MIIDRIDVVFEKLQR